jgi:hypothetical protein
MLHDVLIAFMNLEHRATIALCCAAVIVIGACFDIDDSAVVVLDTSSRSAIRLGLSAEV